MDRLCWGTVKNSMTVDSQSFISHLVDSLRVAVTNSHKLGSLKQQNALSPCSPGGSGSEPMVLVGLEGSRGGSSPASSASGGSRQSWICASSTQSLPLSKQGLLLWVYLCVCLPRIPVGFRASLLQHDFISP
jgi:hypothetical protein